MKKPSRKAPSQFESLIQKVDNLISIGFGLGVAILVALFIYVLVTQFLTVKP